MKYLNKFVALYLLLAGITSCHNQDAEFDIFNETGCYFPYQYPARTIILGEYDLGFNDNDNNHCFEIGVSLTGLKENDKNRKVFFEVDNSLMANVKNVKVLPEKYYEIETESPVIIPKGDFKGRIKVQLKDDFFDDPQAIADLYTVNYALPMVITGVENIDSYLTGTPAEGVNTPNRLKSEDWSVAPKDYVLYGIKYINKYHGKYLRRGIDKRSVYDDETSSYKYHSSVVYRAAYVERDEVTMVSSSAINKVTLSNAIRRAAEQSPGDVQLELVFNDDENCIVMDKENNQIGTGKFVDNGDMWGGKERDVIYLEYSYIDDVNNEKHEVNDTLVIRDRAVVFEQFKIELN